jgi:thiosulfate/3-mercaptopyruvate sulfurtransferase
MRRASSSLVSAVDVRQNIFKWRTIDASWYLSAPLRGKDEFSTVGHLPGAVFLDIDAVSDRTTSLPHMLPSKLVFEDYCQSVGLENSDTIVIYDSQFFSSFRSWFMFKKVFGHESVLVLDGGLPAWRAIGGELEMGAAKPRKRSNYTAVAERKDKDTVVNFSDVTQQSVCVLDARPAARFRGEAPEPRPTLHAGHIPGEKKDEKKKNLRFDFLFCFYPAQVQSTFLGTAFMLILRSRNWDSSVELSCEL